MVDNIIKFGLIENPHRDISKRIKNLLSKVREFKNIVDMFCEDDVPEYIRGEVEGQVDKMFKSFGIEQKFLELLFHHPWLIQRNHQFYTFIKNGLKKLLSN